MAQPKPNLNVAYAAAALAVLGCGVGAFVVLAGVIEVSTPAKVLVTIAAVAVASTAIAAVSAAVAATRMAARIPSYTAELNDLQTHVKSISGVLLEQPTDGHDPAGDRTNARLGELAAVVAQCQTVTLQSQEMMHHVMSKLDALRSVTITPSPAIAALDREDEDTDIFPVVNVSDSEDPTPAEAFTHRRMELELDEPIRTQPSMIFRPTAPPVDVEQFDSVDKARARVEDLMALGNWISAVAIARQFAANYRDDSDAQWLEQRVSREYEIYREGSVRRFYDQIKEELERKHYRRALSIARRLLDKFADHKKCQKIRMQLPTILENAEIEERQEEENRIHSFIKSKRYSDAVDLGEALLAKYPLSPQASSLEEMLPRLRDLAIEQEADMLGRR